jgi:hypothetical protein
MRNDPLLIQAIFPILCLFSEYLDSGYSTWPNNAYPGEVKVLRRQNADDFSGALFENPSFPVPFSLVPRLRLTASA